MNEKKYDLPNGKTAVFCYDDNGVGRVTLEAMDALMEMLRCQWIPVTERLPEEDGGLYLVTDYAESINRRRIHLSWCYVNKDGFWSDVPKGYKVIAWMPLPEPYKEKTDE
ncbi:MAG: DUF551 domain-containing protein [Clostridia bacterium]|nr:DUF551 domain-containing protein [Clostridia bacterium]